MTSLNRNNLIQSQGSFTPSTRTMNSCERGLLDSIRRVQEIATQWRKESLLPHEFSCPITFECMEHPNRINRCGHIFELAPIAQALENPPKACPMCRTPATYENLEPDQALQVRITNWLAEDQTPPLENEEQFLKLQEEAIACEKRDEAALIHLRLGVYQFEKTQDLQGMVASFKTTQQLGLSLEGLNSVIMVLDLLLGATPEKITNAMKLAKAQKEKEEAIYILTQVIASDPLHFAAYDKLAPLLKFEKRKELLLLAAYAAEKDQKPEIAARYRAEAVRRPIPTSISKEEWANPQLLLNSGKLPPYPEAMQAFLEALDPSDPSKKARETHIIVPLFKELDGKPRTLGNLDALDRMLTGGTGCRYIWEPILDPTVDKPAEADFEWAVMTKDVLPGTKLQTYETQKALVQSLGYKVPGFLDAATAILWEKRRSGDRFFADDSTSWTYTWTYTRCEEKVRNWNLIVGGFTPSGLYVYHDDDDYGYGSIGVAGLRKF